MNEEQLIKFLIRESEAKYTKLAIKYKGSYDKKEWQRILTVASTSPKRSSEQHGNAYNRFSNIQ